MMKVSYLQRISRAWFFVVLIAVVGWGSIVQASGPIWQRQEVNWRMSGGSRIRAISYPEDRTPPIFTRQSAFRPRAFAKQTVPFRAVSREDYFAQESTATIIAGLIESPPINGFISWIVVAVTDARLGELELDAVPSAGVVGNYLTSNPERDYVIGVFDTGAGAHIMGSIHAAITGVFDAGLLTSAEVELIGVTGRAFGTVSQPLGVFIDGLGAIEPNGLLLDRTKMVGEGNVSILVRQGDGGLLENFTAVGSPLSVYFTAVVYNDQPVTIIYDGNDFTGPDIRFFESFDPGIPNYPNLIPLELRPRGAVSVQYFPNFDPFDPEFGFPMIPSVLTGFFPTQSLFFASSVDLVHGGRSAIDKDGFMVDTGAQVTVISEAIAARLGLNLANPDFEVEILDVTGDVTIQPGFYIDLFEITATPQWLSYANVPVVVLDAPSPEGGRLDGIIGMNLFVDFNFVFRSGGLPDMGGHRLEFEPIPQRIDGDIAPAGGDDKVDFLDLDAFAQAWLATPRAANWNQRANMAPRPIPDGRIDFLDFAVLAEHWLEGTTP